MKTISYKNIGKYLLVFCLLMSNQNLIQAQNTSKELPEHRVYRIKMAKTKDGITKIIDTTFTNINNSEIQDILKNLKEGESLSLSDKIKIKLLDPKDYKNNKIKVLNDSVNIMIFRDKNLVIDTFNINPGRESEDHHIYIIPKDSTKTNGNRKQIILIQETGANRITHDSVWHAVKVPDELIPKSGKTKIIRLMPGRINAVDITRQKDILIPVDATSQAFIINSKGKNQLKPVKKLKNVASANSAEAADLKVKNLKYFPNPSNGRFNLSFNSSRTGNLEIEIFNAVGQKVYSRTYQNFSGRFNQEIDISNMGKGVFLLKIGQNNSSLTRKVVVE